MNNEMRAVEKIFADANRHIYAQNSSSRLRSLPDGARREMGFQIDRIRPGLDPDHWKPMQTAARAFEKFA
jgi:phage-related protein